MKKIAIVNQKGGVGKTTSTINIGAGLVRLQKKVCLIDLDPQAQLTYSLGIKADELDKSIFELLKGEVDAMDIIISRNGLSIIPSGMRLSEAEVQFSTVVGREFMLEKALSPLKDFDYILFDCPPSLGILTLNALTLVKEAYIVLQAEFLPLEGMSTLLKTVEIVKERLNNDLKITGIIGTRYNKRKILNKEIIEKVKGYFGSKLFKTLIRDNISLAEAPSFGQDIFTYKPDSFGAVDYLSLCKEIIKRQEHNGE